MPVTDAPVRPDQTRPGAAAGPVMMKAVAVFPGRPDSMHLATMPKPSVDEIPGGRGVLVKVLRVGVDGTDKEINAAEYGAAPVSRASVRKVFEVAATRSGGPPASSFFAAGSSRSAA